MTEQQAHEVLEEYPDFELRRYADHLVAVVTRLLRKRTAQLLAALDAAGLDVGPTARCAGLRGAVP